MRAKLLCAVIVLGLILSAPAGGMAFTFNTIDVPGATLTLAHGINNIGQIVGAFYDGTTYHGFLKDGTTFTTIDAPDSPMFRTLQTQALGINDDGQIVGTVIYFDTTFNPHGFLKDGALHHHRCPRRPLHTSRPD